MISGIGVQGDSRVAKIVLGDTFQKIGKRFGFQKDNIRNQEDNFISIYSSLISRKEEINLGPALFSEQIPAILKDLGKKLSQSCGEVKLVTNNKKIAYAFCAMHEEYFRSHRLFIKYLYKNCPDVMKDGTVRLTKIHSNNMTDMMDDLALAFLIWGEAGNVRFLPEPLKLLYFFLRNENLEDRESELAARIKNNPRVPNDTVTPFLDIFIKPIYEMIVFDYHAKTAKNKPTTYDMPNDHDMTRNYDDLNEQAWTRPVFLLTLYKKIWESTEETKVDIQKVRKFYTKTFVEKRGYLAIPRAYQRMCTLFIGLLATMIWATHRIETLGFSEILNANPGASSAFIDLDMHLYFISLPIAAFLALNDFFCCLVLGTEWERGTSFAKPEHLYKDLLFTFLIATRVLFKVAVFLFLLPGLPWLSSGLNREIVSLGYLAALALMELLYFIDIWGVKPYACLPAFVNIILGTSAFNSVLQVGPASTLKSCSYGLLWGGILAVKFVLAYFSIFAPLYRAHEALNDQLINPTRIEMTFFHGGDFIVSGNLQELLLLTPIWLIVGMLFFADIEFYFILITAISSAAIALHHHVMETAFDMIAAPFFNTIADKKAKLGKGLFIPETFLAANRRETTMQELIIGSVPVTKLDYNEYLNSPADATLDQLYGKGLDLSFRGQTPNYMVEGGSGGSGGSNYMDVADSAKNYRPLIQKHSWIVSNSNINIQSPISAGLYKGYSQMKLTADTQDLTSEFMRSVDMKNFADEFNCIVMSWRDDDIISNAMVMELQFVITHVKINTVISDKTLDFPAIVKPSFLSVNTLDKITAHLRELLLQCAAIQKKKMEQATTKALELLIGVDQSAHARTKFMELCIGDKILRGHDWERLVNLVAILMDTVLPGSAIAQVLLTTFYHCRQAVIIGWVKSAVTPFTPTYRDLDVDLDADIPSPGKDGAAASPSGAASVMTLSSHDNFLFYRRDAETNPGIKRYLEAIGSTGKEDDLVCPLVDFIVASAEFFKALKVKENFEAKVTDASIAGGMWKNLRDMIIALTVLLGGDDGAVNASVEVKAVLNKDLAQYKSAREHIISRRPFLLRLQHVFHSGGGEILSPEACKRVSFYCNSIKSMAQLKDDRAILIQDILSTCTRCMSKNKKQINKDTLPTSGDDVPLVSEEDDNVDIEDDKPRAIAAPPTPKTIPQFHQPHAEGIPTFTSITPYYNETISESLVTLLDPDTAQGGMNVLTYLKTNYDKEWLFMEERVCRHNKESTARVIDLPLAKITKQAFHNFLDNATQFTYAFITDLAEPDFLLEVYASPYYVQKFSKSPPRTVLDLIQKDFDQLFTIKLGEGTAEETTAILADLGTVGALEKDCSRFIEFVESRFLDSDEKLHDLAPRQRYERFVQLARVIKEVNHWASRRGPTLYRAITGVMRNEEAIVNQFLREIDSSEAPTTFPSPYYRHMYFKTASILRNRSIVSAAVYNKLPTWLQGVSGINFIFRDREYAGTMDLNVVDPKAVEMKVNFEISYGDSHDIHGVEQDPDCSAVLEFIMQELNLVDTKFGQKLIKAVLYGLGSWNSNDLKDGSIGSDEMIFGMLNTAEMLARKKFRYLVSVQTLEQMKEAFDSALLESGNGTFPHVDAFGGASAASKYAMIFDLMTLYPGLQVSYIETVYHPNGDFKCQYSKLVSYDHETASVKEQYSVELPGPFLIGNGKAENQNHAVIFTRGEGLQALDMDQDLNLEEAGKFGALMTLMSYGKILGFKEVVNNEDLSTVSSMLAYQETIFASSSQRVSAWLRVRQHYGHPDIFHRIFIMTNGGMSKASQRINQTEDIFSGFNFTLRGGNSEHYEFLTQVKAKDVSLDGVVNYTVKQAYGVSEQLLSRDVLRIAHQLDIFRHLSFYFSSACQQTNAAWMVLYTLTFVYVILFMNTFNAFRVMDNTGPLDDDVNRILLTLFGQQFALIFILIFIPGLSLYTMERGALEAISVHIKLLGSGALAFFPFLLGTRAVAFHTEMTYGKGEDVKDSLDRAYGLKHSKFIDTFRQYFDVVYLGVELVFASTVAAVMPGNLHYLKTVLQIAIGLIFIYSPFIFNPSQFNAGMLNADWNAFYNWMVAPAGDGDPEKSWNAWCSKRIARNGALPRFGKRFWYIVLPPVIRRIILVAAMCVNMNNAQGSQNLDFEGSIGCFFLCAYCIVFVSLLGMLANFFNNIIKYEDTRASLNGSVNSKYNGDYISASVMSQIRCFQSLEGLNKALINFYRIGRFVVPTLMILFLVILISLEYMHLSFILWLLLTMAVLMYTLAYDVYLAYFACENANLRKFGSMPSSFSRSISQVVHIMMAAFTIAPVFVLSVLPFVDNLQYRMLYYKDFTGKLAANYEALKSERSLT